MYNLIKKTTKKKGKNGMATMKCINYSDKHCEGLSKGNSKKSK